VGSTISLATLGVIVVSTVAYGQQSPPPPASAPLAASGAANPTSLLTPDVTEPERQGVLDRPRPDFDALGLRAGSFLAFPNAEVTENYDSNVFATTNSVKSDFFTELRPGLSLRSDWNNNALTFDVSGDIKRYAKLVSENVSNLSASAGGRLDVEHDVYFLGGAGYQLAHEDRASPDSVQNTKSPIEYHLATANLGYVHQPGRLGFRVDGLINSYSYENGETAAGGVGTIIETDRNRTEYSVTPRLQYELVTGYHAFVQASANMRDYEHKLDQFGFNKSSKGYETDIGTAFQLGAVMNGDVFIGYLDQSYDDHRLADVSGVAFGGSLLWNVTAITSIRGALTRTVQETSISSTGSVVLDASSYLQTTAGVSIEHELRRNFLLTGGFSYANQEFRGITRTDDTYETKLGMRYLINRNLTADLTYSYRTRSSDAVGNDYDRSLAGVKIRAQF
jgi:hypothetical protein